jgi:hypothetical protein
MNTIRIKGALIGSLLNALIVMMVGCGTEMTPAPLSAQTANDMQLPTLAVSDTADPAAAPTASETENPELGTR